VDNFWNTKKGLRFFCFLMAENRRNRKKARENKPKKRTNKYEFFLIVFLEKRYRISIVQK